jgi:hypothetical protein
MKLTWLVTLLLTTSSFTAHAAISTAGLDLDAHSHCSKHFATFENQHQIPSNLLKSISLIESGIWHSAEQSLVPWPWAVNAEGKPYLFKTKREAVSAVQRMLSSGQKSIDVGCMQINLHYHPNAFASIEQAFDPKHNIEYAASFLKSNYVRHENWRRAVAAYHSETEIHGTPYAAKVIGLWNEQLPIRSTRSQKYRFAHETPQVAAVKSRAPDYFNSAQAKRRKSGLFIRVEGNSPVSNTQQTLAAMSKQAVSRHSQ